MKDRGQSIALAYYMTSDLILYRLRTRRLSTAKSLIKSCLLVLLIDSFHLLSAMAWRDCNGRDASVGPVVAEQIGAGGRPNNRIRSICRE